MFGNKKTVLHLCSPKAQGKREFSSVGSEHLPYKQRVGGSNPSTPTIASEKSEAFFVHFCEKYWSEVRSETSHRPQLPLKPQRNLRLFLCIFVKNIDCKFEAKRRTALNSHYSLREI